MLESTIVNRSRILVSFLLWVEILNVVYVTCNIGDFLQFAQLLHLYWLLVLDVVETTGQNTEWKNGSSSIPFIRPVHALGLPRFSPLCAHNVLMTRLIMLASLFPDFCGIGHS
jgi:hypothetical protein